MAAYKLLDFSDIYTAIQEELRIQSTDAQSLQRIQRSINMVYLNEVVPATRWYWLYGNSTITHQAYYGTGTVSVTPTYSTVTLSIAPSTAVGASGSFLNYLFSIEGTNEIYKITAHTAEATTFTIDRPFNGTLNATASYKVWCEDLALPTDLRETIELWHDHAAMPMEPRGLQEFRRLVAQGRKTEGRPFYYSTYDYRDPSTGDGETESDRYRLLKVFPAISQYDTHLRFDYVKEATALELPGDEPMMPVEDRIVLFYGALAQLWSSLLRNPEEAARNYQLFQNKLAKMMGKIQDSMDKPRVQPDSTYMSSVRGNRIKGLTRKPGSNFGGGQSTYNSPTYLKNVTIEGATITANVTVNSSITIDGRDISVDGATLDAHIASTSGAHTAAAISVTPSGNLAADDVQEALTELQNDIDGINTLADGKILIGNASNEATEVTPSGDVTITNAGVTAITADVIVDADVKTNAAITLSKLAALTASRAIVSDGSGVLSVSAITSTEITYLDDVEALTSATLADNTSSPTLVAAWAHASFNFIEVSYSLARGAGNREKGTLHICTDGSTTAIAQSAASMGTLGTTFTVDISGADVRLLYVTTSTGTAVTMKYKVNKW